VKVDATLTYHCDIAGCGETETQHLENVYAATLPSPRAPRGWLQVGHLLFCPLHSLFIEVDGQELSLPLDAPAEGS